jgi:hypothetical protein
MRQKHKIPMEIYTKRIRYEKILIFRNIQGHHLAVMRRAWELVCRKGFAV